MVEPLIDLSNAVAVPLKVYGATPPLTVAVLATDEPYSDDTQLKLDGVTVKAAIAVH